MASFEDKREGELPKAGQKNGTASLLLRFGEFTLDLQRHGLYRGSERIHLTSKPFETLAVLVEHRGKTVEKQKLLDAVWKDAFVTEDSLVKAIRAIRRALDDEKSSPQFIQTVPGEGYRFIAEVTPVNPVNGHRPEAEPEVAEVQKPDTPPAIRRLSGFWTKAVAGALLATFTGVILWRLSLKSKSSTHQRIIAEGSASRTSADSSPDSNWIAFIDNDANGVPQVWVKHVADREPTQITSGDVAANHPRWSPKNDRIVFNRVRRSANEWPTIWTVPPFGGSEPTLLMQGRNPNWSSDGNRLVYEKGNDIWTANADGTNQKKVVGVPLVEYLQV